MSLGILNNLNAIYAENSLNSTNNSLQTVLQQLSSGSRINSGADDAAGLALVVGGGGSDVVDLGKNGLVLLVGRSLLGGI